MISVNRECSAPLEVLDPLGRTPRAVAGTSSIATILRHAEHHSSPASEWVAVEVAAEAEGPPAANVSAAPTASADVREIHRCNIF